MAETKEQLRTELAAVLEANSGRLKLSIQEELQRPKRNEDRFEYRFEIDPFSFRISSCSSEETFLPDDWLIEALGDCWFDCADELGINWDALIADELFPWFSETWRNASSNLQSGRAFLFFHGYHARQFNLGSQTWCPLGDF